MKWRVLKSKQDCAFWSSEKYRGGFPNINDSVESDLQKWILSHPCVIQYTIKNYCIKVNLDGGNGGSNDDSRCTSYYKHISDDNRDVINLMRVT